MNIYLVEYPEHGCDSYTAMVVIAESKEEAITIAPDRESTYVNNTWVHPSGYHDLNEKWAKDLQRLTVKRLGRAEPDQTKGLIIADYDQYL